MSLYTNLEVNGVVRVGNVGDIKQVGDTSLINIDVVHDIPKKGQDGKYEDTADWVRLTLFGKKAEMAEKLQKGEQVHIRGVLSTRSWEDSDGKKQYATGVTVNTLTFCGGKKASTESSDDAPADSGSDSGGFSGDDNPF